MVHFFTFFYSHHASLSVSLSSEAPISQNSLKLTLSNSHLLVSLPSAQLILNITATKAQCHWPTSHPKPSISLKTTSLLLIHFRSVVSVFFIWMLEIFYLGITSKNGYNIKESGIFYLGITSKNWSMISFSFSCSFNLLF